MVSALASGDLQIGNLGSWPAGCRGLAQRAAGDFYRHRADQGFEALVVRDGSGINGPQDLIGKTIATPFVSTSHYSLLGALKHWNLTRNWGKVVNLSPAQITAAWKRGDIDGAFTWSPALEIRKTGKILTDAEPGQ